MTSVTENDLKELKDLIIAQNQTITQLVSDNADIKQNLTRLTNEVVNLTISQAKIEGKLDTVNARLDAYKPALDKIPDLAEKVGELKNWRQFTFTMVAAFLTGAIGWFLRGVKF